MSPLVLLLSFQTQLIEDVNHAVTPIALNAFLIKLFVPLAPLSTLTIRMEQSVLTVLLRITQALTTVAPVLLKATLFLRQDNVRSTVAMGCFSLLTTSVMTVIPMMVMDAIVLVS